MDFVSDFHLHSKYSMAVSKDMTLPIMAQYARKKGIEILSTGDWTHPLWFREIKAQLTETNGGLFQLKSEARISKSETNTQPKADRPLAENFQKPIYFLLSVEISCIFTQKGKSHRMHNLVLSPSIATAEKISQALLKRGCNLSSDGRPIIGLTSKQLLQLVLETDERAMLIPCHIWTPWFSLYGANSGFDRFEDCFEDLSEYIYGIETGLSSDPEMNWQIKDLDTKSILSFSDAHSPAKMGREATVFRLEEASYENIRKAIMEPSQRLASSNERPVQNKVLYTIEFYPEEGKYHYNGHRNCNVYQTPDETREKGVICPVCKRKITVGVMQRVEDLAGENVHGVVQKNQQGLKWIGDPKGKRPPFVKMVPLNEIIGESFALGVSTIKVKGMFDTLCNAFGSELAVLLKTPISEIKKIAGAKIAEGVAKVRAGDIHIKPGYDNEYGIVKIWSADSARGSTAKEEETKEDSSKTQLGIDF